MDSAPGREPFEGQLPALPGDGASRGDRARSPPAALQSLQLAMDLTAPVWARPKAKAQSPRNAPRCRNDPLSSRVSSGTQKVETSLGITGQKGAAVGCSRQGQAQAVSIQPSPPNLAFPAVLPT